MLLYALWAGAGWCGTPWPGWWRGPRPHPDPEPWLILKVVAIVGGIIGGVLVDRALPAGMEASHIAVTAAGAFVAGRVLSEVVGYVIGGRGAANVSAGG